MIAPHDGPAYLGLLYDVRIEVVGRLLPKAETGAINMAAKWSLARDRPFGGTIFSFPISVGPSEMK